MMQSFTYLLIDFFTIIVCFVASFHPRIQFHKHFGIFLVSSTIVAIPFIVWDMIFTAKGIWWFNLDYTIGFTFFGLPLEECLFFYCIPFACIFTYFCLNKFFDWSWTKGFNSLIVFTSTIVLAVIALLYYERWYTFLTAIATLSTLLFLHFIAKKAWIGQASIAFLILMLGFFPVNGILTGTGIESPIVNYNPDHFLGIRMLTIPVEDAVYGYTQFLLNIYFFELLSKKFRHGK